MVDTYTIDGYSIQIKEKCVLVLDSSGKLLFTLFVTNQKKDRPYCMVQYGKINPTMGTCQSYYTIRGYIRILRQSLGIELPQEIYDFLYALTTKLVEKPASPDAGLFTRFHF